MLDVQDSLDFALLIFHLCDSHAFGFYLFYSDILTGIPGNADPGTVTVGALPDEAALIIFVIVV
jgi:hypothetical protein